MYYNNKTQLFFDGRFVKASEAKIDLFSQTLHYGNGVFEGIRSYNTTEGARIFKAREHFERFFYSAEKMHMKLPYSVSELVNITHQLLNINQLSNAYIRPLAFMGSSMSLAPSDDIHLMITAWEWGRYLGNGQLNVMISSYQRPNPKACHIDAKVVGHYCNSVLATQEAKSLGYDEALMLDMNGNVAEGPGTNFFYEKDGILYTPTLGHILPGITRTTIMEIAAEMGYPVVEKEIKPEELFKADAAFFTGTAAEVAGIRSINGNPFKLEWEESLGYGLFLRYRAKVTRKDLKDVVLV
jgi:branched-chain amino acid aminotransferase